MSKGLTLVELLVTLAILAIVAAISTGFYRNTRQSAAVVSQDKDLTQFVSLIETFKATGGNLSAVTLAPSLTTDTERASALTALLQSSATAANRTVSGVVGDFLSADMVVVPYAVEDGNGRLVIQATTGDLRVANVGSGYRIVSRASLASIPVAGPAVLSAVQAAFSSHGRPGGAQYSSSSNYAWNVDNTLIAAPGE